MGTIRILVVDDHAIVRTGLVSLLGTKRDFEVVGEASDGASAVTKTLRLRPDVVIMDLVMPGTDGAAAATEIHAALPETKVLVLTTFGTSNDIVRALDGGATGALLKSVSNAELVAAIRSVAAGRRILSPEIEQMLADEPPTPELSPRQMQILDSITRGLSNAQIAAQFGISAESVKTHVTKLFQKLGAANRSEAATIALRKHLLKV